MEQTLKDLMTLTGLSTQDYNILRNNASQTQQWADEIVKIFYDTLFNYAPTAKIFKKGERSTREKVIRDWYLEVTSGTLSRHFWHRLWLLSSVHLSRGVTFSFMFGMMSRIEQVFLSKCLQEFEPSQAETVYKAFKRVTDVTMGLIAEGYLTNHRIEKIENVRAEEEGVSVFLTPWMMAKELRAKKKHG